MGVVKVVENLREAAQRVAQGPVTGVRFGDVTVKREDGAVVDGYRLEVDKSKIKPLFGINLFKKLPF